MEASHLDELILLEESYWWHLAKRHLVTSLLTTEFPAPAKIVEGGIVSSRNLLEFQQLGYEVVGFDVMEQAVEYGQNRGLDVSLHDLSTPWPLESQSCQAVVLLDVLEHIDNPVQVLRHAAACLRPGGGVIATVPAYPWLYSDWDQKLGHFRRYTSEQFRTHARESSLTVKWLSHWNSFTLPAALAVRGGRRCFPKSRTTEFPRVSPLTNRMLIFMAGMERRLLQHCRLGFGLSLVGVLVK